jgi:Arc/MetJ-type ribon-helix-helix transcriptional regulator
MNLNQYPEKIAQAQTFLNDLDSQIANFKQRIYEIEGWVDSQVASGEYRNDSHRKAARFEILQSKSNYQAMLVDLDKLKDARAKAAVELELARNQYSVLKLEMRMAIADKLIGLESREIAGV